VALPRPFRLSLALAAVCLSAAPEPSWIVARNNHFAIYSQAGEEAARSALNWFEQLRVFFERQMKVNPDGRPPLRVIGFRSAQEYRTYSSRPAADAYYLGSDSRDYIVMPSLDAGQFNVAAHEYAHFSMHAGGMRLPSWLSEGLAEFYSTVHITPKGCSIGGELVGHSEALRRRWMPLNELFSTTSAAALENDKKDAGAFYAESWILTHMLALSSEYSRQFQAFVTAIGSGASSARAFAAVYGKSLDALERDARAWVSRRFSTIPLPGVGGETAEAEVSVLTPAASRLMLADVLFAGGQLDRAEALFRDLAREAPEMAEAHAGLGAIALSRGDRDGASKEWKRAIEEGIEDPLLCYRYAVVAQDAGLSHSDIRPALERAVKLQPDFDDAHYALALLELNTGHNEAAVTQFRAMKRIAPARAYSYWSGLAYTLNELDRRDEAKVAALEARKYASTAAERAHASEIAYMADTDLAVHFTRDANGAAQMVTARAPHNQTGWNPFIEPGDRIRRVEGILREIHCDGSALRLGVLIPDGSLTLLIPDPARVLMRNAPAEFTCGKQAPRRITVEYAAPDIVRGIEFR
jgi:Flp pilus assembly protein TadD